MDSQIEIKMENEPAIRKGTLIQSIQTGYGIDIETLRFHQRGWGGDCYVAQTNKGKRYFLKLDDMEKNTVFATPFDRTVPEPGTFKYHVVYIRINTY